MPASCAACRTRYQKGSNVTFHKFPAKDHWCLVQWAAFTGKGEDWRPTLFHRLCSRHFEPRCFNVLNGKSYLRPGALPTRNKPSSHNKRSLRGRKRTAPEIFTKIPGATPATTPTRGKVVMEKAKSILQKVKPASKEVGQPEMAAVKGTSPTTRSNVPEARGPRQFVPPTRKVASTQETIPETPEKRPIIIHVTSLSTTPSSQRPSRLKRRPVKLRSGEFEEGAPLAKSSRRLRHPEQPPPVGAESSSEADPDAESEPEAELPPDPESDLEEEVEYIPDDYDSDVDAPEVVENVAKKSASPVKVVTVRAGESLLISKRNPPNATPSAAASSAVVGSSPAKAVAGSDLALQLQISQLQADLARERTKNEELTMQFNKAKTVIESQCRNIVALEETINSLRHRLVQMSAKCRSDAAPADAEKVAK
uniref:Putative muscle m-line assembly protein unc-89 n=1 Tax=Ixodes ricinus TaxID=34613 RepID=A0A131Y5W7_IXORI